MCFGALTDGDATELSVAGLLRVEAGHAARQGGVTALAVLVVLFVSGVPMPLAGTAAAAGFLSTVLAHQVVLFVGAAVLRWRADSTGVAAPGVG